MIRQVQGLKEKYFFKKISLNVGAVMFLNLGMSIKFYLHFPHHINIYLFYI